MDWGRGASADLLNPPFKDSFLVPTFERLAVIHLGADATFQPIVIEDIQLRPEPAVLFFQPLHFPVSGGLFVEIGFGNGFLEPLQNCGRDYQFLECGGELVLHHFLPRIWFLTFAAMSGAMVVDVFLFLQLAHQTAPAMPAANEPCEGKIVLDPVLFRFDASIKQGLNRVPRLLADQSFMLPVVGHAVPVKITGIDALAKD